MDTKKTNAEVTTIFTSETLQRDHLRIQFFLQMCLRMGYRFVDGAMLVECGEVSVITCPMKHRYLER